MASHPTDRRRKAKQKAKQKYAEAREDAQAKGLIPTVPEGAVRDEVVRPSSQGEQDTTKLDREAVRRGWAVPDEAKPRVVDRLLEPFSRETRTVTTKDGQVLEVPQSQQVLKENAKVLAQLDKMQWERDHPELAGRARGGMTVVQTNQQGAAALVSDLADLMTKVDEQVARGRKVVEVPRPTTTGAQQEPSVQVLTADAPVPTEGAHQEQGDAGAE